MSYADNFLFSTLNSPVSKVVTGRGNVKTGNLYGVELEMEGTNLIPNGGLVKGWAPHEDGSLRHHHGQAIEWVSASPVIFKTMCTRIKNLFDSLTKNEAKIVCSNRTSTHVHYNMGDKKVYQLVNLFVAYTIFEDLLARYSGEDRNGNLFCVGIRQAQDIIDRFNDAVSRHGNFLKFNNDYRYAGFNLCSLNKFRTVEFRTMRGLDNAEDVIAWLSILNELCTFACYEMKEPSKFLEGLSIYGIDGTLSSVFSEDSIKRLTENVPEQEVSASIWEGLRVVQPLAYKVSAFYDKLKPISKDFWEEKAQEEEAEDDFDRDAALNLEAEELADLMEEDLMEEEPELNAAPPLRLNPFGHGRVDQFINRLEQLNVAEVAQRWNMPHENQRPVRINPLEGINNRLDVRNLAEDVQFQRRPIRIEPIDPFEEDGPAPGF